jgi:nicotinamide mononucleotide transporter
MDSFLNALSQLQSLEIIALCFALIYVVLAAKKNQWCWPFAFCSTALYTAIFWQTSLISESILNAYYMIMAVVGWLSWHRSSEESPDRNITVMRFTLHFHVIAISLLSLVAVVWGWIAKQGLGASLAFADAFTTVFALFATWLLTQRVRENWLYWIVIDAASVALYQAKGLWISSLLMMFYTVFAIYGWWSWGNQTSELKHEHAH